MSDRPPTPIDITPYSFHYSAFGNRNHPAILFLHGFMGSCREFNPAIALLSDRFYCVAVDLPGHGDTSVIDAEQACTEQAAEQAYAIPSTAKGLVQLIEALGIKPCFLVGYSMGGRLALYLALQFPDYFLKVVLESASPGLKTPEARSQRIQADRTLADRLEAENFSSFLEQWYEQPLFATLQAHPAFAALREQRLNNCPAGLARSLRQAGTGCQPSLWERLKLNNIPLLLLVGGLDAKFLTINREMAGLCELVQLKIADRCGHTLHIEDLPWFLNAVQEFFAEQTMPEES